MGVITAERLRGFMSSPRWSAPQTEAVELICAGVESSLEDALYGTFITPRPWAETAPVLTDGGLVDTTYPVHRVSNIDGQTIGPNDPLPARWRLQGHRLHLLPQTSLSVTAVSRWPFLPEHQPARPRYSGHVDIAYEAGWGPTPALVLALLRKAQKLVDNRHSDTVTVRGLTATAPPNLIPEDWTDAELKALGRYRRLGIGLSRSPSALIPEPLVVIPDGTARLDHEQLTGLADDDHSAIYPRYTIGAVPPETPRPGDLWLVEPE